MELQAKIKSVFPYSFQMFLNTSLAVNIIEIHRNIDDGEKHVNTQNMNPDDKNCIYENLQVGTEFIRGVSGGERKRTNVGMELITKPSVLFLDEPTTGLDASTANAVMHLLATWVTWCYTTTNRILAIQKARRIIICSLKVPSNHIYIKWIWR